MARRQPTKRLIVRDRIAGTQFRLELFRTPEADCSCDWSGGYLVSGSLRLRLSAEHASNLARRMRAVVDNTVSRSLTGLPGGGE